MRYTTDCRTITNMPPAPGSPMVRGSLGSFGCAVDWMCATGSSSYLVPANSLPSSHSPSSSHHSSSPSCCVKLEAPTGPQSWQSVPSAQGPLTRASSQTPSLLHEHVLSQRSDGLLSAFTAAAEQSSQSVPGSHTGAP